MKTTLVYPLRPRAAAAVYRRHRGQWLESPPMWLGHSAPGRKRGILPRFLLSFLRTAILSIAATSTAAAAAFLVSSILGPAIGFLPACFPSFTAAAACLFLFLCFVR